MVDKEARNESLAYVHGEKAFTDLKTSELPVANSGEARSLALALKPEHYARLALAIETLLDYTLGKRSERPPLGLLNTETTTSDPFNRLSRQFTETCRQDIDALHDCRTFQQARQIVRLIGVLETHRFISLTEQLRAGMGTATATMLSLLRDMPSILRQHEVEPTLSTVAKIARRSVKLPTELAMICINQMVTVQCILESSENRTADPAYFQVHRSAAGAVSSVAFTGLGELILPANTIVAPAIALPEGDVRVADVPCAYPSVIGCPVTFLPGRINQLWNWFIDLCVAQNTWELPAD